MRRRLLFAVGCVAACAATAQAPGVAIVTCRALVDAGARLACYDAIEVPMAPRAAGLPGDMPPARSPLPQPAVAPAAPLAAAAASADAGFGLPAPRGAEPQASMASRIAGRFEGWGPGTRLRLTNGQVWQVADDTRGAYELDSPAVRIKRGVLGSFFIEIDGVSAVPRVRRVD